MAELAQNEKISVEQYLQPQGAGPRESGKLIRNRQIHFFVNEEEEELIMKRMALTGIKQLSAYLRKMAIDGYTIKLDLTDMKEAVRLLRISSNNINQYAKKANETDAIYKEDIQDIQKSQEELWTLLKEILRRLADI